MLKLETVAVMVRDEEKAAKWWKENFGFRIVTSWAHWYTVAPKGARTRMHLCIDGKPEKGNTGFLFVTKDIRRELARLRKKRVKISKPLEVSDWGTTFMFADPDGNEFWVIEE